MTRFEQPSTADRSSNRSSRFMQRFSFAGSGSLRAGAAMGIVVGSGWSAGSLASLAGVGIGIGGFAQVAHGQDDGFGGPGEVRDIDVYENRPIYQVLVRGSILSDGERSTLSPEARQQAINVLRSQSGGIFDAQQVRDDVRQLNRLGLFQRVEIYAGLTDTGEVEIAFDLLERMQVIDVQVTGNTEISDAEIQGVVDVIAGTPIDRFQIDRSARRIEELYRGKGYYFVRVNIDEEELADTGLVIFRVLEGNRLRVTGIRFSGNEAFENKKLRREIETKKANLFRRGQLDDEVLAVDIGNLIEFYRDRGYLDIRADRLVQPAPNGREAIVTYLIEEGSLYTMREVQVDIQTGEDREPILSGDQIAGLMTIKPGDVYSVRDLDESLDIVREAYGQMGYIDAQVERLERRDENDPLVDLVIAISEGGRSRVGEVIVQGNDLTRQEVIRRQVELRPTRPLDSNAMERSKTRLRLLRLFNDRSGAKVTPQESGVEFLAQVWDDEFVPRARRAPSAPPSDDADAGTGNGTRQSVGDPLTDPISLTLTPPDNSKFRDVLIEIEETNTGNFDLGGAVSSDSGVVGRIAVTQRNFDIRDTPDSFGEFISGRAFRGGGQTFQIEVLPGNEVQTYRISLSDPYLFESNYSGSASAFFRNRDFDEFDEQRAGATLGVGRRFGSRWTGNIGFRYNLIELGNIDPSRTTDVFAVADPTTLVGLSASLSRTTLDSQFRPTRGSRTSLSIEQVVGDFEFTPMNIRHTTFVPIREDYLGRSTILKFSSELGYIPQGRDNTPTYERYYMGGQDMRGFDFRTVSPRGVRNDNGLPSEDPIGGTFQFFLGAEIQQPVYEEVLSVVAFIDSGTVSFDPGFDEYRVSVGFGFRIYMPALSPAPLAFDFGFPVVKEDTDEERLFTFSVDLPFN
ncbi:MAG: outer membrane protein assembly factor [Phycisphaerales bacterium]